MTIDTKTLYIDGSWLDPAKPAMTKIEVKTIRTWIAMDGRRFDTPEEAKAHEDAFTRGNWWRYRHTHGKRSGDAVGLYEIGYTTTTARTVYDTPAFLREGGDREVQDHHHTVLARVSGTYDAVVEHAVAMPHFWSHRMDAWITQIEFMPVEARAAVEGRS